MKQMYPCSFLGVPEKYKTKNSFMREKARVRIRGYLYHVSTIILMERILICGPRNQHYYDLMQSFGKFDKTYPGWIPSHSFPPSPPYHTTDNPRPPPRDGSPRPTDNPRSATIFVRCFIRDRFSFRQKILSPKRRRTGRPRNPCRAHWATSWSSWKTTTITRTTSRGCRRERTCGYVMVTAGSAVKAVLMWTGART